MCVSLTIAVLVVQVLDEDDAVQQVTTPRQRDDFLAALTAAEDWLYDQGEDEQAGAFRWGPSGSVSPDEWLLGAHRRAGRPAQQ